MYKCAEKNLIANILQQAVADLWLHPNNNDSSLGFFLNEEYCYGSFLWCCDILDVAPGAILKQVRNRLNVCIELVEKRPVVRRKKVRVCKLLDMMKAQEGCDKLKKE